MNRQIYLQVGSVDTTVGPRVMDQLQLQLADFAKPSKISFVTSNGATHVFPTDFNGSGDNPCSRASSPYISNCEYDGAGAVLQWMYGDLVDRNTGTLSGSVVSFAQSGSYGTSGMAGTGYLYVPEACNNGSIVCKLHVALHGCQQSFSQIGTKFIENTGFNKWAGKTLDDGYLNAMLGANAHCPAADTNNIIILYPQATIDYSIHPIWGGLYIPNPNACFDWVGWYGSNADQKGGNSNPRYVEKLNSTDDYITGTQMTALVNQVNQIISGYAA